MGGRRAEEDSETVTPWGSCHATGRAKLIQLEWMAVIIDPRGLGNHKRDWKTWKTEGTP